MARSLESSRTRTPSPTRINEKQPPAAPALAGGPPGGGPPGGRPGEAPFSHGFFDKDPGSVASRKMFVKATIGNTIAIVLMIWGILVRPLCPRSPRI